MRDEKTYNKVVAINKNTKEIYLLDYLFYNTDDFKGATGSVLQPYTQSEIDDRRDVDEVMDCLMDIVEVEQLQEQSLRELAKNELDAIDEDEFFGMDTGCNYRISDEDEKTIKKILGDDIVNYDCVGGGRCFNVNMFDDDFVILDDELVKEIYKYETQ